MNIAEKAVQRPVTVVIVFTILFALGIYCGKSLSVDMYPAVDYPTITVVTSYASADPEEVERSVTRVLETALSSVTGIKHITSTSSTGYSRINLEFNTGTNLDEAANDIRDKIERTRGSLPNDATQPVTTRLDPSLISLMTLVIKGNRTPEELYDYASNTIEPSLEQIDGIASADIVGGKERCIKVEIPRDRLEAYSLTITQIVQMLNSQNKQSAAGMIDTDDSSFTVTASGVFKNIDDVKNAVIAYRTSSDNTVQPILLRDIADVYEGTKTASSIAYLDGQPCVMMNLHKQSGKNSVQAAHNVRNALKKLQQQLPSDVSIVETANNTDVIEDTISEVVSSVVQGALLAILVLFIFLRSLKGTIIIGLTIPVSIIITLAFMYFKGMTLNLISLAGLLIGVGMLVDNSIVILENIYTYRARGENVHDAAIHGAQEMIPAVTSSTLTSVCIFLPMMMFSNMLGSIGGAFLDLGFTISVSLVCSLVTSIVLVPVLAAKYLPIGTGLGMQSATASSSRGKVFLIKSDHALGTFFTNVDKGYSFCVRKVLHHKAAFISVLVVLLIAAIASIPARGFIYMPSTSNDSINLVLTMPKGTKLSQTESVIREMESIARQQISGITFSNVTVGDGKSQASANTANLRIMLTSDAEKAKDKLRPYFNKFPGAEFSFGSTSFSMGSSGYSLQIKCNDLTKLRTTATEVKELIETKAGDMLTEVNCDITEGMPQIQIVLDRENVYSLGLTVAGVENELRANINGITSGSLSINGNDTDIVVTLAEKDKAKVSDLNNIFVTNSAGRRIPLSSVAHYEQTTAPASINREDQTRIANITGIPVKGVSTSAVQKKVNALIKENIPKDESVSFVAGGDYSSMIEQAKGFLVVIIMAMILVFAVMAAQFQSFKDPFIVLLTIPLSFIGVAAIYALTGATISILSILGMLMLVGVIVNNGIVLVDYTNILRSHGMELEEACVEAARSRLRPIMMSTLTTLISLVPMALFPDKGAEMIQPINLTVLGGLGFGTIMTLFLMPTVYYIFNKKKAK